jgi:hypothetical protein
LVRRHQVPLGVGFQPEGKLSVAEVGFDVSGEGQATAERDIQ